MKIFMGLLVLALVSSQFAHSNPVDTKADDDDYLGDKSDDNYDDNYDDDDDEKKRTSTQSSFQNTEEPYKTQAYVEKAEVGRTVTLKCLGDDLDSSTLFMWYNDSQILFQDKIKVTRDDRIVFLKDGSLTIREVNAYDDGRFRCRAFHKNDRFETQVQLTINGPPRGITIGHNTDSQDNIAGKTLKYRAGVTNLRFKCNVAKGRPQPKIDWIHNGNTFLASQVKDHDIKIEDESVLIIRTLHARHAGEYQCEASNEFGNLKALFKIEVEYPPFFMHHRYYFNAEENANVELHCLYKSFPAPKSIKWLKGGSQVHDNDKYMISNDMKEHHDRTKLLIRNVDKKDLMMYQCLVENDLGMKTENVTLGVGPAPAIFDGYKFINNIVYTDWIIKSRQELMELQILYRNKEFGWRPKSAEITHKSKAKEGEWKVQGSIELEAGDWIIMARAKNTEGWSDDRFSHEVVIKIPKAFTEPPQTSSSLDTIETSNQTSSASLISQTLSGLLVIFGSLLLHRLA